MYFKINFIRYFLFFTCFSTFSFLHAQSLYQWKGYWEGTIHAGEQSINIIFDFDHTGKTKDVFIDVVQQSLLHYKASEAHLEKDSCKVIFLSFGASFTGHLVGDSIIGLWDQNGNNLPLTLHPQTATIALKRPQTPKGPFSYQSEEISFPNRGPSIVLGGTLTKPLGSGSFHAVILITGSGQQDRNESVAGHQPFWVLADYLTGRGMAVLRLDDRGIGKTTGNFKASTTLDFAADIEDAVQFLMTRKDIRHDQIGLLGHSEGGLIAPIIASRTKAVAFIILLAGPGLKGDDLLREQDSLLLQLQGAPAVIAGAYSQLMYRWQKVSEETTDSSVALNQSMGAYQKWLSTYGDSAAVALFQTTDTQQIRKIAWKEYQKNSSPWLHRFLQLDPASYLKQTHCPVLVLQGSLDAQVPAVSNTEAIKKALALAGNDHVTVEIFPGLNHLFQHCADWAHATSYALIEETIAPEAMNSISVWLHSGIVQTTKK